ncbi:hydratase [Gilvimarinus agarilyticus]|uniref:hydratase n=1 Tax=unclassified Gilvimarinus TaxID=2642066 RepID=UPI001C0A5778|nr:MULTISPECIES: hydratase [unclassified Gilvimarinus]MBU2885730.1 hydratase [Gilvimarinus agarilyticus]MDO6570590.1 hydratase [Gilvimarinus sp. 2_MG-2023]MDO6748521.1 hydratase [Gilvimarinus sp. 1_MG-2023]
MTDFQKAAQELLSRRKAGTKAPRLDESIRPNSIDDALAVQAEMAKIETVGGWKCLLPPAEDKIIAAPIFNVQKDSDTVELFEDKGVARVEPEVCFVLGQDLPVKEGGYSEADIVDAIGSAHMALELMQSRYADDAEQSFFESLADCMINQGVFVGPEIDKGTAIGLNAIQLKVTQGDDVRELDGKHPNDRAIDGLVWLVNYMGERGVGLKAGAAIITGSFKGIVNMVFDVETTIAYEGLGEYTVTFKRA